MSDLHIFSPPLCERGLVLRHQNNGAVHACAPPKLSAGELSMPRVFYSRLFAVLSTLCLAGAGLTSCAFEASADSSEPVASTEQAIINGTLVTSDSFGVVQISSDTGFCSGTLINNQWVLTAKHCVGAADATVTHEDPIGTFNAQTGAAANFQLHATDDVALIRLNSPFVISGSTTTFNNTLWTGNFSDLTNHGATCVGYGFDTYDGWSSAAKLRQATCAIKNFASIPRPPTSNDPDTLFTVPNSTNQVGWRGDSGSTCFANNHGLNQMIGPMNTGLGDSPGENNKRVYWDRFYGSTGIRDWIDQRLFAGGFEALGAVFSTGVTAASTSVGQLHVIGVGTNNHLLARSYINGWTNWQDIGGLTTSDPAAVSNSPGRMSVFVRGTDNALWYTTYNNGWTNNWFNLGGVITSAPAAVSSSPGVTYAFAKGSQNDIWYRKQSVVDGPWSDWNTVGGGTFASEPAVAALDSNIYIFARKSDNNMYYAVLTPSGGTLTWLSLGGNFKYGPAATSSGPGRVDLFAVNQDGSIAYTKFHGSWATTWGNLGYVSTSSPDVTSWGSTRMDVVIRGTDNGAWHIWRPW